jgi:hypothetical protein
MRKFVSLPTKIMSILMAFLLFASVSLTYLWVNKNNQDYSDQQQTVLDQYQQQFELIRGLLRTRMESWFESFVHFQANYADNIEATAFFSNTNLTIYKLTGKSMIYRYLIATVI